MENQDIRDLFSDYDLTNIQVAKYVGISPFTLSHWLGKPLNVAKRARIYKGLDKLARDKKKEFNKLVKG